MLDIKTIQELIINSAWLLPLVTGLTEVAKRTFAITGRFIPLTSIIIGLLVGLTIVGLSIVGGVVGVVLGLGGVGLWEFGKTTVAGKTSVKK